MKRLSAQVAGMAKSMAGGLEKLLSAVNPKSLSGALSMKVPSEFDDTIVAGLTPRKLASILKSSVTGEAEEFFRMAEEMEELDPHYRSVLATRKLAISGLEPEVIAAGEDAKSKEIAEFVRAIVAAPEFAEMVTDLLDGLAKGYSVCEVVWDTNGNQWKPSHYLWHEPQNFSFNRATRRIAHRNEDGTTRDLEAFKFVVHVPKLKSGLPIRGSLARMAAWSFLFKNYTIKDWVRFIEIYGMPIRIGKYTTNATEDDKRKLLRTLQQLGSDAVAVVPVSAAIEFQQASSGTASQGPVFGQFAEYLDKQVSKGVLGQTMTSDDGSSKAQAVVHNDVREDIAKADARQLTMTIMRDLIIPAVALNFGQQQKYPLVYFPAEAPEDVTAWLDNIIKASKLGMTTSLRQMREKLQADEPKNNADTLGTASPESEDDDGDEDDDDVKDITKKKKAKTSALPPCPQCGQHHAPTRAVTSQRDENDEIDLLLKDALKDGASDLDGLVEPVLALAARAKDYDEFIAGLSLAAGEQEAGAIVARLGPLMFMARGLGDATDKPKL